MHGTLIYREQPAQISRAAVDGDDLWLSLDELKTATGWELRPQGACLGDLCVPIPAGREAEFVRDCVTRLNLTALGRLLGQAIPQAMCKCPGNGAPG